MSATCVGSQVSIIPHNPEPLSKTHLRAGPSAFSTRGHGRTSVSSNPRFRECRIRRRLDYTKIGLTAVQTTIVLVSGGQPNVLHFQKQGAYEMARLVALGVQALNLPISQFVVQAKLDGG